MVYPGFVGCSGDTVDREFTGAGGIAWHAMSRQTRAVRPASTGRGGGQGAYFESFFYVTCRIGEMPVLETMRGVTGQGRKGVRGWGGGQLAEAAVGGIGMG